MRRCSLIALAWIAMLSAASAGPSWGRDWVTVTAEAKKRKLPILLNFTGSDWCPACIDLKKRVFSTDTFSRWSAIKVVLLEVDRPRHRKISDRLDKHGRRLMEIYKVDRFPTTLLLDYRGAVIGKVPNYEGGPEVWIEAATNAIAKNFDPRNGKTRRGQSPIRARKKADPKKPPAGRPAAPKASPAKKAEPAKKKGISWSHDYEGTLDRASRKKRWVLLAFVSSDATGPNKTLASKLLKTTAFRDWALSSKIELVEIDFPKSKRQSPKLKLQNVQLKRDHSVRKLPALLLLDSRGKQVATLETRFGGKRLADAKAWVAATKKVMARHKK